MLPLKQTGNSHKTRGKLIAAALEILSRNWRLFDVCGIPRQRRAVCVL
jgi:hypothetical protein